MVNCACKSVGCRTNKYIVVKAGRGGGLLDVERVYQPYQNL